MFGGLAGFTLTQLKPRKGKPSVLCHLIKDMAVKNPAARRVVEYFDKISEMHIGHPYKEFDYERKAEMIFEAIWDSVIFTPVLGLSSQKLNENFSRLEECIYTRPSPNRAWAYIHQFDSEVALIRIEPDVMVREATYLERALFKHNNESERGRTSAKFIIETLGTSHFLKLDRDAMTRTIHNRLELTVRESFRDVISLMRIIHPSSVGVSNVYYVLDVGGVEITPVQNPFPDLLPPTLCPMGSTDCRLSKNQVRVFLLTWKHFQLMKANGKHQVIIDALRRFDTAICSSREEDTIRNGFVILESLFPSVKGRYLRTRVSIWGSVDNSDASQIMETLNRGTKIRNSATHGSKIQTSIEVDFIKRFLEVIARTIHIAILFHKQKDGIDQYSSQLDMDTNLREKHRRIVRSIVQT